MLKLRRERRLESGSFKEGRRKDPKFTPMYNGNSPKTYEEYYGVGYERFNNKFVNVKELTEAHA